MILQQQVEHTTSPPKVKTHLSLLNKEILVPIFLFALISSLTLWHHLLGREPRIVFFSDSRHYLDSCRQCVILLRALFNGLPLTSGTTVDASSLLIDGPVLPFIPAIFFALVGKIPTQTDWQPFIILGCCLNGFAALLIFSLMRRLTSSLRWSILAAFIWGTYPPAIIDSGRYLTEIPAVTLLLALLLSTASTLRYSRAGGYLYIIASLASGTITGLILLLKPAISLAAFAIIALLIAYVRSWKQRAVVAGTILTGACLFILPWALYTKAATGNFYLTPQRLPVYNAAVGCNIETDGWGTTASTPLTALLSGTSGVLPTMQAAWNSHPQELVNLMLRKLVRLVAVPWNDFRTSLFGIPASLQTWWHCLLLILAIPGTLAILTRASRQPLPNNKVECTSFLASAIILSTLAHLAYLPFETISRYEFTAMPLVTLLAVYGLYIAYSIPTQIRPTLHLIVCGLILTFLWKTSNIAYFLALTNDFRLALLTKFICESALILFLALGAFSYILRLEGSIFANTSITWSKPSLLPCITAILVFGTIWVVALAFYLDGRHAREWSCTLSPGESAYRELAISAGQKPLSSVASILIDGDSSCTEAHVSVNGHTLNEPPVLLLRRSPSRYLLFNMLHTFSARLGKPVDEMRQWRIVTFPTSYLNLTGKNTVKVSAPPNYPVTIYGDYIDNPHSKQHIPSFDYLSPGMLCNSDESLEARVDNPVTFRNTLGKCWLDSLQKHDRQDLSHAGGRQSGQYRIFVMLSSVSNQELVSPNNHRIAFPSHSVQTGSTFSRILSSSNFDPVMSNPAIPDCQVRINRAIMNTATTVTSQISIPQSVVSSPYARIKVTGYRRAPRNNCQASVVPVLVGAGDYTTVLPTTPSSLNVTRDWQKFEIADDVPPQGLPGSLKSLAIGIYPGAWEQTCEYGCDRFSGDTCFRDIRLDITPFAAAQLDNKLPLIY